MSVVLNQDVMVPSVPWPCFSCAMKFLSIFFSFFCILYIHSVFKTLYNFTLNHILPYYMCMWRIFFSGLPQNCYIWHCVELKKVGNHSSVCLFRVNITGHKKAYFKWHTIESECSSFTGREQLCIFFWKSLSLFQSSKEVRIPSDLCCPDATGLWGYLFLRKYATYCFETLKLLLHI